MPWFRRNQVTLDATTLHLLRQHLAPSYVIGKAVATEGKDWDFQVLTAYRGRAIRASPPFSSDLDRNLANRV
jgi:hypothetical protein